MTLKTLRGLPGARSLKPAIATLAVLVVVVRSAWVCDDAYITFRTIDNLLHGYGARWNAIERVQTYTHPLWFLVLTPAIALTRSPYYASLLLSGAFSAAAVLVVAARVARTQLALLLGVVLLAGSKAFVDFSTSGLENALSHFLLAIFYAGYLDRVSGDRSDTGPDADSRRGASLRLGVLAGACIVNRLDLALIVLPALVDLIVSRRVRRPRDLALGVCLPVLAWEVAALTYYGAPFPNTAYAKLQTGIPRAELVVQGLSYIRASAMVDPMTIGSIGVALMMSLRRRHGLGALALGIVLYVSYVVWIGGDFMSGRFLTAPFLVSVIAIVSVGSAVPIRFGLALTFTFLALSLSRGSSPLLSGGDYSETSAGPRGSTGIVDERGVYYQWTGLLPTLAGTADVSQHPWADGGRRARGMPQVLVAEAVGLLGYFAGPAVHIVDSMGLGDPLLARLPAAPGWRVGHFARPVPAGYIPTLARCLHAAYPLGRIVPPIVACAPPHPSYHNEIAHTETAALYDTLRIVIAGRVWSLDRLMAIFRLNVTRPAERRESAGERSQVKDQTPRPRGARTAHLSTALGRPR